jgi:hypothetical protein
VQGDHAAAATAYGEYLASDPPTMYLRQEALSASATRRRRAATPPGALDAYTQAGASAVRTAPSAARRGNGSRRRVDTRTRPRAVYESLLMTGSDEETKELLTQEAAAALNAPPEAAANSRAAPSASDVEW